MNTPVALLAVFSCLLFIPHSTPTSPPFLPPPEIVNCSKENHIDALRGSQLGRKIIQAQNDNDKCYLSCYLKATGYFTDGKINFKQLFEDKTSYLPEDRIEKKKAPFDLCVQNMVYEGKSDCEIAYSAYECIP